MSLVTPSLMKIEIPSADSLFPESRDGGEVKGKEMCKAYLHHTESELAAQLRL